MYVSLLRPVKPAERPWNPQRRLHGKRKPAGRIIHVPQSGSRIRTGVGTQRLKNSPKVSPRKPAWHVVFHTPAHFHKVGAKRVTMRAEYKPAERDYFPRLVSNERVSTSL